jgi:hypothetical protein
MHVKKAESIEQVEKALKEKKVCIYLAKDDGLPFVLNPFGGGSCATQEVNLSWQELDKEKLTRVFIVSL